MAFKELVLFQKIYDFFLFAHPIINRFPKSQRFVLGQTIENGIIKLLTFTIRANKQYGDKRKVLQDKISDELDILRILFRLSCDLKFISIKQYKHTVEKINEIGRILAGWKRVNKR